VDTAKKALAGGNRSAHAQVPNAKKLDENTEAFRHESVSHDFKMALQQARLAKKLNQATLAATVNEKPSVINDSGKAARGTAVVNAVRRAGDEVDTAKKALAGGNRSAHAQVPNAKKLDENTEAFRHESVSHDFKMALQQARLAKKLNQATLAATVNEKPSVINDYESGKAIPNGAIISKLNRALGVRLPKAK